MDLTNSEQLLRVWYLLASPPSSSQVLLNTSHSWCSRALSSTLWAIFDGTNDRTVVVGNNYVSWNDENTGAGDRDVEVLWVEICLGREVGCRAAIPERHSDLFGTGKVTDASIHHDARAAAGPPPGTSPSHTPGSPTTSGPSTSRDGSVRATGRA